MAVIKQNHLTAEEVLALRGLRLPGVALRILQKSGIYCEPAVSIQHQKAWQYMIRGVESGGAVAPIGAYCSFVSVDGKPLVARQRIDTVGVNGLHAVVLATDLVRLQMFRTESTCDLLITHHTLVPVEGKHRPSLRNSILFHGKQGALDMKLWGENKQLQGAAAPVFYGRGGAPVAIPAGFFDAVLQVTAGACCIGCRHTHLVQFNDSMRVPCDFDGVRLLKGESDEDR